jgi:hypothetical protein
VGTIDEDGSFDVVDHLPMSGGWWWSLLVFAWLLVGPSRRFHPSSKAASKGDVIEHPRITNTRALTTSRGRSEIRGYVSLCSLYRFLTLDDMF